MGRVLHGLRGRGAALAGLVIVAVSVNVTTIISIPGMAARAGATIASLVLIVIVSALGLIPAQSITAFGIESLLATLVALVVVLHSAIGMARARAQGRRAGVETAAKSALQLGPALAFTVGSLLLVAGTDSGLGWIAAGVVLAVAGCVVDAWVVLVEILR